MGPVLTALMTRNWHIPDLRPADSHQAYNHHARASATAREIGASLEEARALDGIGHRLLHDGNSDDAAAAHLNQALMIYQHMGAPTCS